MQPYYDPNMPQGAMQPMPQGVRPMGQFPAPAMGGQVGFPGQAGAQFPQQNTPMQGGFPTQGGFQGQGGQFAGGANPGPQKLPQGPMPPQFPQGQPMRPAMNGGLFAMGAGR